MRSRFVYYYYYYYVFPFSFSAFGRYVKIYKNRKRYIETIRSDNNNNNNNDNYVRVRDERKRVRK